MGRSTAHYADSETNNILKRLHNKQRPAGTPLQRVEYTIEQEANEFAGRLLVPESRLRACFDEYAPQMERLFPNFMASGQIRDNFAQRIAPRFGVNSQVIAIRLDRDSLWPAS